jgi:hypothetical protein
MSLRKYSVRFALLGLTALGAAAVAPSAFAGGHHGHGSWSVSIGGPGFGVGYGSWGGGYVSAYAPAYYPGYYAPSYGYYAPVYYGGYYPSAYYYPGYATV